MIKELKSLSGGNMRGPLREALRLGVLAVSDEEHVRILALSVVNGLYSP
ncbi:MAG: hypothetical protein ACTSR0_00095 [Candidatus Asgardarchaeia archaeon]